MASDPVSIEVDGDIDIDKVVDEELAAVSNSVAAAAAAAGVGAGEPAAGSKRRLKKVHRQNSKENSSVSQAGFIHGPRSWKNSRRSRNGYGRGLPKKGGAGGKGVWGLPGSELLETYEDINDPNFDSENLSNGDIELKAIVPEISYEEFKKKVEPIILEYFENGDTNEASIAIEENVPKNHRDMLVEQMVEVAMDHKNSHREMTSVLISDLFGHVITEADITKAFQSLLANITDLILDIPDAPTILGNFIARAIADDCIPPKFLTVTKEKSDNEVFQDALARADTLLSMKHGLVRLHNVWGVGGALRPVKSLTRQMNLLLQEFLSSRDVEEASRCLRSLEVPHFHHELVYEAILMALEANHPLTEEALCELLSAFAKAVLITTDQMERGFLRVFDDLADIQTDVPLAYIILDRFMDRCHQARFLTSLVMEKIPNRGRKRFVSEGDQQYIKNHKAS